MITDEDDPTPEEMAATNHLLMLLRGILIVTHEADFITIAALNTVVADVLLAIAEGDVEQACVHADYFGREAQRIIRQKAVHQ